MLHPESPVADGLNEHLILDASPIDLIMEDASSGKLHKMWIVILIDPISRLIVELKVTKGEAISRESGNPLRSRRRTCGPTHRGIVQRLFAARSPDFIKALTRFSNSIS